MIGHEAQIREFSAVRTDRAEGLRSACAFIKPAALLIPGMLLLVLRQET